MPAGLRDVLPGIRQWELPMAGIAASVNCWLLGDDDALAIVDTGPPAATDHWRRVLTDVRWQVDTLVLTHHHVDHCGSAALLGQMLGLVPVMTPAEWAAADALVQGRHRAAAAARLWRRSGLPGSASSEAFAGFVLPPATRNAADTMILGGRTWSRFYGGGHSPDPICLYAADAGLLLAGDQLLSGTVPFVGLDDPDAEDDPLAQYHHFLDALADLPDDVLVLPGHGAPFTAPARRAREIRSRLHRRDERLLAMIERPKTCADILPGLFRDRGETALLAGIAMAHLQRLVRLGLVRRETLAGGAFTFTTTSKENHP